MFPYPWPGWYFLIIHIISFWFSVSRILLIPREQASLSVKQILPLVLFNQLVVTPITIWFLLYTNQTVLIVENSLFDLGMMFFRYPLMIIILNFAFALAHYSFHRIRFLYHYVHSIHHQLRVPHPIGAIYAHPIEHVFANLLPVGLAIMLTGAGWYLSLIFIAHTSYETVNGHTLYQEQNESNRHHLHHSIITCNYDNSPYIFDKLIGTYR